MSASKHCKDVARSIRAFVDGELDASHIVDIERHVDACTSCAQLARFERATRRSIQQSLRTVQAPQEFRDRMLTCLNLTPAHETSDTIASHRILSWRFVGPMAAAATIALIVGTLSERKNPGAISSQYRAVTANSSAMTIDNILEDLVDQHVHPLPPETTNPTEMAGLDRFVGVPVRAAALKNFQGHLLGARVVPVQRQRAAMLQFVLSNGHRVSVYVYDPHKLRVPSSPALRQKYVDQSPVYVGSIRGYSVAVTDKQGVGYAVATDLDEHESSQFVATVAP